MDDTTRSVLLGDIRGFLSIAKPDPANYQHAASDRPQAYAAAMLFYTRALAAVNKLEMMP